tara:strand:- start:1573 stop:2298 length:726 start_codon:yes stop_codon:yes gene_type:complete
MIRLNTIKHYTGTFAELPATLPYGDTYFATDGARYFVYDQDGLPREVTTGSIEEVEEIIKTNIQGYIGLQSASAFGGVATTSEILIDDVNEWQDVVMTVDAQGTLDARVADMKTAQPLGYAGNGTVGNPIEFLLEGLVEQSTCNLKGSLSFIPDEDGGRLDARMYVETNSSEATDFQIDAAGLVMESGADESYPNYINVQFFVGTKLLTVAAGDAGKVKFQIKSDVTGTVLMDEMALFVQL